MTNTRIKAARLRKISRPNGRKAIARLEKEIDVLIANAPCPRKNDELGSIEQSNARINKAALFACLTDLYADDENRAVFAPFDYSKD